MHRFMTKMWITLIYFKSYPQEVKMFIVKKRNVAIILVIIFSVMVCFFSISALKNVNGNEDNIAIKVVLDAGHGGIDNGVSGINTGVKESDLNLAVVKKLKVCYENAGIKVVLTRADSNGLYGVYTEGSFKRRDMENRRKVIEKTNPDIVISVHMNKFSNSSRRGAQVFFTDNNKDSVILAESIQKSFNDMEESVKKTSALKGDYFILNSHNYVGCIVECGFLSNPEDEQLLITSEYQEKIAYAIFKGSIDYLTKVTFYGEDGLSHKDIAL